ncbi:DNA-processing protein DprA [Salinicoccus sp. ID82-1]|uniref:DNA-processing protein DprA n=1 Tax=Salinicoccus sp. ID82-1 TaxID=2820269 RepID=UPI001F008274|nr:DNA-processing protein DprA [Salinicoccus sp. ID82-1]MCG1008714.1 DNA-processing protein DprA [Salinicoccus sp. ID82-1]
MDRICLSFAGVTAHEYKVLNGKINEKMTGGLRQKVSYAKSLEGELLAQSLTDEGIGYMTIEDENYPVLLKEIHDPPYILYYQGDAALMQRRMLGIVGSRKATCYTGTGLKSILPELDRDIAIVSGLAHGADDLAHLKAMENGLATIGVLAFGHGTHYPRSTWNTRLKMEGEGLVISEYPPAAQVAKWRFVARNRIIAGLSEGVLVTEAEARSGSLITLDMALNENRHAYCMPGNIHALQSKGTNLRIQEGAKMVLSGADIMEDFNS